MRSDDQSKLQYSNCKVCYIFNCFQLLEHLQQLTITIWLEFLVLVLSVFISLVEVPLPHH